MKNLGLLLLAFTLAIIGDSVYQPYVNITSEYKVIPECTYEEKQKHERWSENMLRQELELYNIPLEDINNLIKIAYNESRYNPNIVNDKLNADGSIDSGLFQINSRWHKDMYEKYDLLNPYENIAATVEIYNKYGLKPWIKK